MDDAGKQLSRDTRGVAVCTPLWGDRIIETPWPRHFWSSGDLTISSARNQAARSVIAAGYDFLIFADACILMLEPELVMERVGSVLDEEPQTLVHCMSRLDYLNEAGYLLRSRRGPSPGGVIAVSKLLFERVGGWDERFETWGGEDNAFLMACARLGARRVVLDETAVHVWHPRSPRGDNQKLLNEYREANTSAKMRELIKRRSE